MRKLSLLFVLFVALSISAFVSHISVYAEEQELGRAYFKVKDLSKLPEILSYIHHDFSDRVFSIQAPKSVIDKLKNNPNFEFKGEK